MNLVQEDDGLAFLGFGFSRRPESLPVRGHARFRSIGGPVDAAITGDTTSRGRPDLAEPLRTDGERAGRDVPVGGRGHHVRDRPNFGWGQSMRRRVRTGRPIVTRTRVLQAVARYGIDSATIAGTAGAPAMEHTRAPDPRLAGSGSWLVGRAAARTST